MAEQYWIETLGCPKNEVDSDKLVGTLSADGMTAAESPEAADLIVVNTCAFIESAREESVDTILTLRERSEDARLVVTGCMAERYGDELDEALEEVDTVAGFGVPVTLGKKPDAQPLPSFDLLNLPRPASSRPWAYVKIAEGCDRNCGFCAIPTFRGPQRSRSIESIVDEVRLLEAEEIVLVAQDLAAYGRDQGQGERAIVPLLGQVADMVERVRLLYLYPSDLNERLIEAILNTGVPYFDLSLQHVSRPLCGECGDGVTANASSNASSTFAHKPPTQPFGRTSSLATQARQKKTTTHFSASSKQPNSTGVASFRTRKKKEPTQPNSTARSILRSCKSV